MLSSAIVSLALAASALANVFMTSPVDSTSFTAGQPATVSWQDDGNKPSLADWGNADFAIFVGNALEQTLLQTIATSINVAQQSSFQFTPVASIGPNSGEYFIRATSLSLKDASEPQYPQEAFSAKFTMGGMSGTFNSSLQAEINGQSTAPLAEPSTSSASGTATGTTMASTTSGTAMTTTSASPTSSSSSSTSSTTSVSSSSSASPSASSTSTSGAAKPVITTGLVGLVAVLVGASFL